MLGFLAFGNHLLNLLLNYIPSKDISNLIYNLFVNNFTIKQEDKYE